MRVVPDLAWHTLGRSGQGTAWQPARAEDSATQHGGDGGSCARSEFRVLIDVGHTATSPGADSTRGVPEYDFNLKLADVIAQSMHEAGFDKTVRLVTSGTKLTSLFQRAANANNLHGDLFISIHHDSVPDNLKETWQYEGKKNSYCDRFSGYAIFVSNDNVRLSPQLVLRTVARSGIAEARSALHPALYASADGAISPRIDRRGSWRLPVRSLDRAAQYADASGTAGSRIDHKPARGA